MCDLHKAEADYECKGFSIQSKKKKKRACWEYKSSNYLLLICMQLTCGVTPVHLYFLNVTRFLLNIPVCVMFYCTDITKIYQIILLGYGFNNTVFHPNILKLKWKVLKELRWVQSQSGGPEMYLLNLSRNSPLSFIYLKINCQCLTVGTFA